MESIELPTDLVKEALDCVVPYLALSRKFVDVLIEELEAADLSCDHSVGICCCAAIGVLNELKLMVKGKMTCPNCGGDGMICTINILEDNSSGYRYCDKCNGTGQCRRDN